MMICLENLSELKFALAVSTGKHQLLAPCGQADLVNMQSGSLNLPIVSSRTGFVEYDIHLADGQPG